MELRQLNFFVEITKAGSLNRAAKNLHISQPALSRHIQALEWELAAPLFERSAAGMALTAEGLRLLELAEDLLRRADSIRKGVKDNDHTVSGAITIGAAPALGHRYFGAFAELAAAQYPHLALRFCEGHAYDLLVGLEKDEIDIALTMYSDSQKGLEVIPLYSEPIFLLGPPNDPEFNRKEILLSELKRFPLIMYPKLTAPRKLIDKAILRNRVTLDIRYESNYPATIIDFVRRRLAYALIPKATLQSEKDDFSLMAVRNFRFMRGLVYKQAHTRSPEFVAAVDVIKSAILRQASLQRLDGQVLVSDPA